MKFGENTYLWTATFDDSLDLLLRLKDYGCDGVEIHRFEFAHFPTAKIRAAIEQAGLECTVCSGFRGDMSLISDDASVRQKTLSFLKQVIGITSELGATVLSKPQSQSSSDRPHLTQQSPHAVASQAWFVQTTPKYG